MMAAVEATIRSQPLPRLAGWLGCRIDLTPWPTPRPGPFRLDELAPADRRRWRCTQLVADASPNASGPCLRRALVGGHLLRAQQPSIRIGVSDADGILGAHAWLVIDDRPLEDVSEYQVFRSGHPHAEGGGRTMSDSTQVYAHCGLRIRTPIGLPLEEIDGSEWDLDVVLGVPVDDITGPPPGDVVAYLSTGGVTWYTGTRHGSQHLLRFHTGCGLHHPVRPGSGRGSTGDVPAGPIRSGAAGWNGDSIRPGLAW